MSEYQPDKYTYNWIWDKKVLEKEFYSMRDRIAKATDCLRHTWLEDWEKIRAALAALEGE